MARDCETNCPEGCPAHSGVEAKLDQTDTFIKKIMTNHLPHIETELKKNTDIINKNHVSTKNWLIGVLVSIILLLLSVLGSKLL